MYFSKIEIENIGPIEQLSIDFHKNGDYPKPLIIVGENGSGKSILLSHLVNSIIVGKQEVYEDVEVEKGKVFKLRSPSYIKAEKTFSYSSIEFESNLKVIEWQLSMTKDDYEKVIGSTSVRSEWQQIQVQETSYFNSTFQSNTIERDKLFKEQCCLYFPVNRFEEPAWLNIHNLNSKATYTELKHISGYSNRDIICISPMKENKNWLLDLIFDRQAFEINLVPFPIPQVMSTSVSIFSGYVGQSSNLYNAIIQMLKVILRSNDNIRVGIGSRKNRQISVLKNEKSWIPNLFQLSTGEMQLLNLFLSILRDYDLSQAQFNTLADVKGIVIIDEIDSHLHAIHQKEILPELIALFPNVQFIITTHAPLFLIGMEEKFGSNYFEIINMPEGNKIVASDFSEFLSAYDAFKATTIHREEIQRELENYAKPILYVEGDYDIRYLKKAAELHNKNDLLDALTIKDGGGYGNLDKVWKSYDNALSEVLPNKVILLYDCDTNKQNNNKNLVYKRVIPSIDDHPIKIGIENLFSIETIEKLEKEMPQFIDVQPEVISRVRGVESKQATLKSVNKDEKGNMCNWLVDHGNYEDFIHFSSVFQVIEDILTT